MSADAVATEVLKRRFAGLISEALRASALVVPAGCFEELQASVARSPGGVLIRLHLTACASDDPQAIPDPQSDELVTCRIHHPAEGRKVIILVTRDAGREHQPAATSSADTQSTHCRQSG